MHKPFQKFGHFVLKNLNDEPNTAVKDKYIKDIYKKESRSAEKSHKRKIKSANDADTKSKSKKYTDEGKHRSSRKKSTESLGRTHKRKELLSNNFSETEIFFISPEEIRKHRRRLVKKEESPERTRGRQNSHRSPSRDYEKKSAKKSENHFERFLKQQKQKKYRDDQQWLSKKEIFKLIGNTKEPPKPPGSSFFKKFFVFDKHGSDNKAEFIPVSDQNYIKCHRYSEDNTNPIFLPFKASGNDCAKASRRHEKSNREESADVMYFRDLEKNKQRSRVYDNHSADKRDLDNPDVHTNTKNVKKRKSQSPSLTFEDLEQFQKKESRVIEKQEKKEVKTSKNTGKQSPQTFQKKESGNLKSSVNTSHEKKVGCQEVRSVSQTRSKSQKKVQELGEEPIMLQADLDRKLHNVCRANPVRHRFCLVKNTFPVVEISPTPYVDNSSVEKKKKLKAFKKYYKYNRSNDKDSEITNSTACYAFSDSHKMYQDMSEQPVEDTKKKRHSRNKKIVRSDLELKLETHVSSVVINPRPCKVLAKPDESIKDQKIKKSKTSPQKSKIPVPSNHSKIVELARDASPVSKSRKRSADLFSYKAVIREEKEVVPKSEDSKSRKSKLHKHDDKEIVTLPKLHKENIDKVSDANKVNNSTSKKEKHSAHVLDRSLPCSKSHSEKSSITGDASNNAKITRPQTARNKISGGTSVLKTETKSHKSTAAKIEKKESKISRTSTTSRQSKVNSFDNPPKNVPKPTCKTKNPPPSQRRKSVDNAQESMKSPSRSSNDTASPIWSRVSSKKSIKSSLASKSDTKVQKSKKYNLYKYKNVGKSSPKTSLSNSTCGDKSMDSSKNGTSFLLTKTYKDDDKLNRWQKGKQYADNLRKNAIGKNQKTPVVPPQILEVRYLTVSNTEHDVSVCQRETLLKDKNEVVFPTESPQEPQSNSSNIEMEDQQPSTKLFYEDDLPQPCLEVVDSEKFNELFALPVEEALNEILNENYNFLQKDFSYSVDVLSLSSDDDLSTADLSTDRKVNDWYNLKMNSESLSEISYYPKPCTDVNTQDPIVGSQDHIIDSLSAPGSEESGYSTLKSRRISTSFFNRPDIKALFDPPGDCSFDCCVEVQIETSSSNCEMEIHSIESKSLQTTIECSQKSVQIKMSREEMLEVRACNAGNADDVKDRERDGEREGSSSSGEVEERKSNKLTEKDDEGSRDDTIKEQQPPVETKNSELVEKNQYGTGMDEEPQVNSQVVTKHQVDSKTNDIVAKNLNTCFIGRTLKNSAKEKKQKKNKSQGKHKFKRKISFLSCFSCVSSNE